MEMSIMVDLQVAVLTDELVDALFAATEEEHEAAGIELQGASTHLATREVGFEFWCGSALLETVLADAVGYAYRLLRAAGIPEFELMRVELVSPVAYERDLIRVGCGCSSGCG